MLERVLVVGLGSIGQRHVRVLRDLAPAMHIVALRHREAQRPEGVTVDACTTSLTEALAHAPQAAVVAGPATRHTEVARQLVDAGVHVLIEKPIAADTTGIRDMLDAAAARGVVVMTGYNLRFLPSLRVLRDCLGDGRLGRVLSVRAEVGQHLAGWRPGTDYRQSVSAQAALGGGVLLELSHELDYLRWLFGEVRTVTAVERRQGSLEIDVPDTALLVLEFDQGGDGPAPIASVSLDFVRHDTTRRCTVIGERGTLAWDGIAGTVTWFAAGSSGWETIPVKPAVRDASYREEWKHFIECVELGHTPLVTGEDGLRVLQVIEAARRSSAARRAVEVEPVRERALQQGTS